MWNRFDNKRSQKGTNIPIDEDAEHSNNCIKQYNKNLERDENENAVQRLLHVQHPTATILETLIIASHDSYDLASILLEV